MPARRRRSSSRRTTQSTAETVDEMIDSIRSGDREIDSYRVIDLKSILQELGISIPSRCKKSTLVELVNTNVFEVRVKNVEEGVGEEQAAEIDNGAGVGVPIGGALPSVSEQEPQGIQEEPQQVDQEQQSTNKESGEHQTNVNESHPPMVTRSISQATVSLSADGRHPDDIAFEKAGGMIIKRKVYERCCEILFAADFIPIQNHEQNAMKFLYERAKARDGSYDIDTDEERAANAANRVINVVSGEPSLPIDETFYNVPADPSLCRLETRIQSMSGDSDVRVLKLRFPKSWSYRLYNLPPPWFCRTEKLEFDADSDKLLSEVTKSIVASLQQNRPIPTYKLRQDQMAPFYLVNDAGDVILLTNDFLKECPKPGKEMLSAPSFYVCGVQTYDTSYDIEFSKPLPHFVYYNKNGIYSYAFRVLFLIFLSSLMLDIPYASYINVSNLYSIPMKETKLHHIIKPFNASYRILRHTSNALLLPDIQYRVCTLHSALITIENISAWLFQYLPFTFMTFSWWSTLVIMIILESVYIWIRSRFCIIGLTWMLLRRYVFWLDPSTSKYGANPNPSIEEREKILMDEKAKISESAKFNCNFCHQLFNNFIKLRKEECNESNGNLCTLFNIWYRVMKRNIYNVWLFLKEDDWVGYREHAAKLLKEAAERNEGMAQIVYEDATTFRYFTYRWKPMEMKDQNDYKEWLKTLRAACGVPYYLSLGAGFGTMLSDIILSGKKTIFLILI
jgi:hypothetical protein